MISADDLEAELSFVRARAAGSIAGVFGPEFVTWKVDREAAIFLGAGRALLLQLAHPWVATAIAEHSNVFADPIGRFHRTFRTTFTMVFGTLDQAVEAARRLHSRHAKITGVMPITAGPFAAGSRYFANETSALHWVHATLVETALIAHDLVLPALSAEERERYYAESRVFAALFGIPQPNLPPTWEEFTGYNEAMWASDTLTVIPHARAIAEQVLEGANSASGRPNGIEQSRPGCCILACEEISDRPTTKPNNASRQERSTGFEHLSGPTGVAAVCWPYQEAVGRLSGKARPSLLIQCSNRFWIGQSALGW